MSDKQVRAQYTREFKQEAVRQVRSGQAIAVVAKVLGIPKASLGNWVRLSAKGELDGAGDGGKSIQVSPEQMAIARLRAENARLRMERDIAKKASAYFAQDTLRGTPVTSRLTMALAAPTWSGSSTRPPASGATRGPYARTTAPSSPAGPSSHGRNATASSTC